VNYLLMIYGNQEKWESMPAGAWTGATARSRGRPRAPAGRAAQTACSNSPP
jgi:hypothetical protein